MSEIYVYGPNDDSNDYSTMGLVGALVPTECKFREAANGDSAVTLVHPLDPFGRYLNLEKGNILSVPVPVRTTPEIQNGSCVTTVWTYKVKPLEQLTSKYQRTLYKRKSGSSRLKIMKPGDILTIVLRPDDSGDDGKRWKAKTEYGTGWINPDGIELVTQHLIPDNSGGIMEIRSPWKVTNQLFRIYESQKTLDKITVQARHISYDLLYNMTRYSSEEAALLQDAIDGVLNSCYAEHGFNAYTNVVNEQPGLFYKRKNPIEAFLNPEEGICKRFNVGLVRDNYDLYFLHDPGTNRGIRVQYRKNMTGINFTSSDDEVVTRIIPIGETKDGSDLFLTDDDDPTGHYIDSPNIGAYPIVHVHELKCENCKVNDKEDEGGKITTEIARARMREQAQELLDAKCDQPTIDMGVEFVNLGDTEEYKHLKGLENCFLYDYIIVQHPDLAIDVTAQIMEIEWDCLMERMNGVQIGSVGKTLANMGITTWQIPAGLSGSKIAGGTIGNAALQSDIISTRHLQSESVNTNALMAKSVSAEKIDTDSLFADDIFADKLYAKVGEFVKIVAGNIEADKIDVDELTANIVKSVQVSALMADFDKATIKNLVAQALFLEYGNGNEVHIKNLSVDYAQMVGATIGNLCIKSSDGKYYYIDVNEDGTVTAKDVSEEIGDTGVNGAVTPDGKHVIVETSMTVDDLNAGTFQAIYALINKLDAAMIDVDELFARKAFIQTLVTAKITSSGDSIEMIASRSASAAELADQVVRLNQDITNLQDQVDGNITTWFHSYAPTLENEPASLWTDDEAKNTHLGDLFYDETTGFCYRFQLAEGIYSWVMIRDTEITKALATAQDAKDTADSKRRVFYNSKDSLPSPPYDRGDLWVQGLGGDILRCTTSKASGDVAASSDWVAASKYTDDTMANEAIARINLSPASVDSEYIQTDSNTTAPSDTDPGWSTTAPTLEKGKYIWTRTKTVLGMGTIRYSDPSCISSLSEGVSSVEDQYYVSDSTDAPDDTVLWKSTAPEWTSGTYLWVRTLIRYSDGTTAASTPVMDDTWNLADRILGTANEGLTKAEIALNAAKDAVTRPEFDRVVRVDTSGLHVGDNLTNSEVLIDSATVNIVVNGIPYSTFGPNFLQLGDDIRIRRPSVGGIAFSPIKK